ncbi:AbrB family transcriptional regulator [Brevibacillus fluminis]|uniref:AbrB family transcriptional regulator n=1 Tax=Brevibacillus fluminis TaxID=511487 RepID=A0A3M8D9H5_9BACL|nr:AbrB family transcriptional regulator [Brevibacillus fluminis]RNB84676.1 AbrB family transcriptional regulator [Brevibacillus fluminis]
MDTPKLRDRRSSRILLTVVTAIAAGAIFNLLHAPIPWLLGPMLAVLIGSNVSKGRYEWPGYLRNAGMIVVGYTIGQSLTVAALQGMSQQLPYMLLMTTVLLLFCAGISLLIAKLSGTDYKTALLGSIPGGLTQVVTLAEETEGVNLTVVTVTQVIRLMIIIICVPLIVFHTPFGQEGGVVAHEAAKQQAAAGSGIEWLLFPIVCIVSAIVANKIKFPTAYLLGPAFGTAAVQMFSLQGPSLPPFAVDAAQLLIGTYVGLLLKPDMLAHKARTLGLAVGNGLLLVFGAWGLSILLTKLQPVSGATALLGLAPGGMDQMGIIAHEIHADLPLVAGYQLFRTFFILFIVPPLLRLLFQLVARKAKQTD